MLILGLSHCPLGFYLSYTCITNSLLYRLSILNIQVVYIAWLDSGKIMFLNDLNFILSTECCEFWTPWGLQTES